MLTVSIPVVRRLPGESFDQPCRVGVESSGPDSPSHGGWIGEHCRYAACWFTAFDTKLLSCPGAPPAPMSYVTEVGLSGPFRGLTELKAPEQPKSA